MGGVSLAGTKSVNGTMRGDGWCVVAGTKSVNGTMRGDGWCVVG